MQTKWKSEIDPVLANPLLAGLALKNQVLASGTTTFSHRLSRMQQGFIITDINAVANIYRAAPFTSTTLTLHSSGAVTVSLWVY